jgi:hypothetical protein
MIKTYGEFIEAATLEQEYLAIGFSPSSVPLKQRWRNNGLSADFLADYLSTFFPQPEEIQGQLSQQDKMRGAVSYIANELLENAMKFNYESSTYPINIRLHLNQDYLTFFVTNSVMPSRLNAFEHYIEQLLNSDTQALYLQKLEENALNETLTSSGLGLLTMLNDYEVGLSWKFETVQAQPLVVLVTTRVQLAV